MLLPPGVGLVHYSRLVRQGCSEEFTASGKHAAVHREFRLKLGEDSVVVPAFGGLSATVNTGKRSLHQTTDDPLIPARFMVSIHARLSIAEE